MVFSINKIVIFSHILGFINFFLTLAFAKEMEFKSVTPKDFEIIRRHENQSCSGIHVGLVISPIITNSASRDFLVIYWDADNILPGDRVELFHRDPSNDQTDPIASVLVKNKIGWIRTDISVSGNGPFPKIFQKMCLGYWAAYVRGETDKIVEYSCLTTEPRWMEDLWVVINNLTISNIFIPGTHAAACYKECYRPSMNNIIYKYTFTQDINIVRQLIWGARAIDLRIGHYPDSQYSWWCNHDFVKVRPLLDVIREVREFLDKTKEIVIFDVQDFTIGFSENSTETHNDLLAFLEKNLRGYLAPFKGLGWNASLQQIKDSGKRIILAYNSNEGSSLYKWPKIDQRWGEKQTVEEFEDYFKMQFSSNIKPPWAALMALSPKASDLFFDNIGGLRVTAAKVGPLITTKLHRQWGNLSHIVYCDFIKGTALVKAAIKWNKIRGGYWTCE